MKTIVIANYSFGRANILVRRLTHFGRLGCWLLFSTALALFLTGCLSKPALVTQSFALQAPAITNATPDNPGPVLELREVQISPLFAGQALVYRIGPNEYETDPYAGFLVPPAQTVGISLRGYLSNSGRFASVISSDSPLKAGELLRVYISELYGDFRQQGHPAAVLSMRMIFTTTKGDVILEKDYTRSVPLKQNTATDVVAGYDQALAGITADLTLDLASRK